MSQKIQASNVHHFKVYYEKGMFGGWPANHGIWIWENEILAGFSKGHYKNRGDRPHYFDAEKPELHVLARSRDGGETWEVEDPGQSGNGALVIPNEGSYHGIMRSDVPVQKPVSPEKINFRHSDFAMTVRMTDEDGARSWYWYSYDRGHTWKGPVQLPDFGTPGIAGRTDYIIDGSNECLLFLTAGKSDGEEGRPFCAETRDGGLTWKFNSWIGPEPDGFSIMPASVRISSDEILVAVRRREGSHRFISVWRSPDNGAAWLEEQVVADTGAGNPPAMIRLSDGRICLVYGYRAEVEAIKNKTDTSDIRARLSPDNGRTWSEEYVLRNDGSGRDIGYPRAVQRPDGKIVVVYYFMDAETGPERYIAATVWEPPSLN